MTKPKGNLSAIDGRQIKGARVLDASAVEQWRIRHELLRQALMKADRQLKRGNKNGAHETIKIALTDDKRVVPLDA